MKLVARQIQPQLRSFPQWFISLDSSYFLIGKAHNLVRRKDAGSPPDRYRKVKL
jgi:hypothetical protein